MSEAINNRLIQVALPFAPGEYAVMIGEGNENDRKNYVQLQRALEILSQSASGKILLNKLVQHKLQVKFNSQLQDGVLGSYSAAQQRINLRPNRNTQELALTIAHEIQHSRQIDQSENHVVLLFMAGAAVLMASLFSGLLPVLFLGIGGVIAAGKILVTEERHAREADARAITARVAYELKEQYPQLWRQKQAKDFSLYVLGKEMAKGTKPDLAAATHASYQAYFADGIIRPSYAKRFGASLEIYGHKFLHVLGLDGFAPPLSGAATPQLSQDLNPQQPNYRRNKAAYKRLRKIGGNYAKAEKWLRLGNADQRCQRYKKRQQLLQQRRYAAAEQLEHQRAMPSQRRFIELDGAVLPNSTIAEKFVPRLCAKNCPVPFYHHINHENWPITLINKAGHAYATINGKGQAGIDFLNRRQWRHEVSDAAGAMHILTYHFLEAVDRDDKDGASKAYAAMNQAMGVVGTIDHLNRYYPEFTALLTELMPTAPWWDQAASCGKSASSSASTSCISASVPMVMRR